MTAIADLPREIQRRRYVELNALSTVVVDLVIGLDADTFHLDKMFHLGDGSGITVGDEFGDVDEMMGVLFPDDHFDDGTEWRLTSATSCLLAAQVLTWLRQRKVTRRGERAGNPFRGAAVR